MVNIHDNVYARRGLDGRSHIPALPFWVAIIRIVQLVFALLVMILTAYAGSVFPEGFFQGYGMAWFTFVWTIIFLLYIFVTPLFAPQFYLYWAHLGLEVASVIFWLTTFALLAEDTSAWNAAEGAINEVNGLEGQFGVNVDVFPKFNSAIKASKAATGLAAINWLLFVVTLISFAFFLHQHRLANGATGFGGFSSRRGDIEKANAAPAAAAQQQHPVELRNVQEVYSHNGVPAV